MTSGQIVNWTFFVGYSIAMVGIGYLGMRRTKTAEDFSIASKTFGNSIQMPLFIASFLSAASLIGFSGVAYNSGWSFLILYPAGFSVGWLMIQLMGAKFRTVPSWQTTSAMFADRFYSRFMRGWMATFYSIWMFLYVVIGLMGVSVIISSFLGVENKAAFLIVGVVFLAYTSMGGMFAVAWTNVVQFALLAAGIVIAAVFGIYKAGGLGELFNKLGAISSEDAPAGALTDLTMNGAYSWTYISGTAIGLACSIVIGTYYHRMFFAAKDERTARSFIGLSAPILLVLYLGIALIGWSARAVLPDEVGQQGAFAGLVGTMPVVLGAFVLIAVAAAVMSSMDNQLLAAGAMVSEDIFHKLMKPEASDHTVGRVARWATLILGLGAIGVALLDLALIIEFYNFFTIVSATTAFVPLVMGLYWKRTTREAGIAGSLFGFAGGLLWYFFGPESIPATIAIMPVQAIVMYLVSRATHNPPKAVIEAFFPQTPPARAAS